MELMQELTQEYPDGWYFWQFIKKTALRYRIKGMNLTWWQWGYGLNALDNEVYVTKNWQLNSLTRVNDDFKTLREWLDI